MTGCTPGQFGWSALPSPITLTPGVRYYLVSEESIGGDLWYRKAPVATESFASITNARVFPQTMGLAPSPLKLLLRATELWGQDRTTGVANRLEASAIARSMVRL